MWCYCDTGCFCLFFFFFKQKTAYEMRISDWSSDVCSSDLFTDPVGRRRFLQLMGASLALAGAGACTRQPDESIVPYVRQPEERSEERRGGKACGQYVSISVVAVSLKKIK